MRTSLTLDNDLAERLKEAARQKQKPFAEVVNEAIRAGLVAPGNRSGRRRRFVARTFRSHFNDRIDETKLNQLVDRLEAEGFLAETPPVKSR